MSSVLKIVTYNVQVGMESRNVGHYVLHSWHHFLPHPQRRMNLTAIAGIIQPFDIVALQELDAGSIRSHYLNQATYLAKASGFPYVESHTTRRVGPFAKHAKAILSRFPIHAVDNYPLPSFIPGRAITTFCIGQRHNPLLLVNVHLSLGKKARHEQLAFISNLIEKYEHVIVMGDFNMQPLELLTSPLAKRGLQLNALLPLPTYPSWKPKKQLDHILLSTSLKQLNVGVIPCVFSDHLPLYMEVQMPRGFTLSESVQN